MKKTLVMSLAAMVAMCSVADIAIEWKSGANSVGNQAGDNLIGSGTYAALVWSAGAPTLATAFAPDGTSANEFLLNSTITTGLGGGFLIGGAVYDDSAVGGADINSGYFFTRIFDTATVTVSSYYSQGGVEIPTLNEAYDAEGLPTPAYATLVYDGAAAAPVFGQTVNEVVSVIPEPATLGLLGVAGLGMFLARKKVRS